MSISRNFIKGFVDVMIIGGMTTNITKAITFVGGNRTFIEKTSNALFIAAIGIEVSRRANRVIDDVLRALVDDDGSKNCTDDEDETVIDIEIAEDFDKRTEEEIERRAQELATKKLQKILKEAA